MTSTSIAATWRTNFASADWASAGTATDVDCGYDDQNRVLHVDIFHDAGSPTLTAPDCPATSVKLSFLNRKPAKLVLPTRQIVQIELGPTLKTVDIAIAAYQRAPHIDLSQGFEYEQLSVHSMPGSESSLRIQTADLRRVVVFPAPSMRCSVSDADLVIADPNTEIPHVTLDTAHLSGETKAIHQLTVSGNCRISDRLEIETIALRGGCSIGHYKEDQRAVLVDRISSDGGELALGVDFEVHAATVEAVSVTTHSGSKLAIRGSATDLNFSGAGTLTVAAGAWIDRVHFGGLDDDPTNLPTLTMSDSAVIRRATGAARIGDCRNAQIDGDPEQGFLVREIVATGQEPSKSLSGTVLRSVRFPVSLAGLPLMSAAQEGCAVVVPHLSPDLPGQRAERAEADKARWPASEENVRADFASSLAHLAETKGAPPSTTTKLAWLEYRMRFAQAKGAEKFILFFYRWLGFGERFWPCVLFYLLLCCTFATIQLEAWSGTLSCDSIQNYVVAVLGWAAGPLHLVSTDRPALNAAADYGPPLGRVLLAVVFGTAVLALRKYVKRSHG